MFRRLIVLLAALVVTAAGAYAQQPAAAEPKVLYIGEVDVQTRLNVRADRGTDPYTCTRLEPDERVAVVEEVDGWLKILPPEGTWSVISNRYVTVGDDGQTGTVTDDNVWVRAAGDAADFEQLRDYWVQQLTLDAGDPVKILGAKGDYYRIAPPAGAYYWVSGQYIDRLRATTRPAETPAVHDPETRPTPETVGETTDLTTARAEFEAAEEALHAEYEKAMGDRDLQAILERYQAIGVPEDSPLAPYIASRVDYLNRAIERKTEYLQAGQLITAAGEAQREFELERAEIESATPATRPAVTFAAEGVLTPSALFPGSGAIPKRYLLRDPSTDKPTAYIQSADGSVDLDSYVGRHVGIIGRERYDRDLGIELIEAEEVTVVGEGELRQPPQPSVGELPPAPAGEMEIEETAEAGRPEPVETEEIEVEVDVAPVEEPEATAEPKVIEQDDTEIAPAPIVEEEARPVMEAQPEGEEAPAEPAPAEQPEPAPSEQPAVEPEPEAMAPADEPSRPVTSGEIAPRPMTPAEAAAAPEPEVTAVEERVVEAPAEPIVQTEPDEPIAAQEPVEPEAPAVMVLEEEVVEITPVEPAEPATEPEQPPVTDVAPEPAEEPATTVEAPAEQLVVTVEDTVMESAAEPIVQTEPDEPIAAQEPIEPEAPAVMVPEEEVVEITPVEPATEPEQPPITDVAPEPVRPETPVMVEEVPDETPAEEPAPLVVEDIEPSEQPAPADGEAEVAEEVVETAEEILAPDETVEVDETTVAPAEPVEEGEEVIPAPDEAEPLPPTGLPLVEPTTSPSMEIDEQEYE